MALWSRRNAGFIVNEDDSGDKIIFNGDGAGVASAAEHFLRYQDGDAENAPKFLSTGSEGNSDYSRGLCIATDSGWAMAAGTAALRTLRRHVRRARAARPQALRAG